MRYNCFPPSNRARAAGALLLAGVLLAAAAASGATTAEKLNQAAIYYEQAEKALLDLDEVPAAQRSQQDYEKVIRAFRRVYRTAPTSQRNTKSLMNIGEVYQVMARNLKKEKYFASAIEAYDFLLREYPRTKYQGEALLATARIYHSDLKQPEEARKRFEQFLKQYPQSPQADEARLALSDLDLKLVSGKTAESAKTANSAKTADSAAAATPPARMAAPASAPGRPENGTGKPAERVAITDIRQWGTGSSTRIVIDLDGEVKYEIGRLGNPPRIYLDLLGTQLNRAVARKSLTVEAGLVKRVRAAQNKADVTRVVLEVDQGTDYSISDLPNPYRLIVDIHRATKEVSAPAAETTATQDGPETGNREQADKPAIGLAQGKAGKEPGTGKREQEIGNRKQANKEPANKDTPGPVSEKVLPARSSESPHSEPEAADPIVSGVERKAVADPVSEKFQAAQPNRDGSRSLTRALGLKIGTIILDPGHGGHDTGTIGPSGVYEKDLVLDVALRLGKLISERLGSEVTYTRQDDSFVPLESRTAIANEKQADLFLSIHANSSSSPRARGVETYYLSFATDPEALEVAARENAVSRESIHELQDLVKKIALNEKVDESKEFAADVQVALRERLSKGARQSRNRGVKKAPFMVLVGARMPSVLAEISFLSNPQEEKLLRTKTQRQKVAEALFAGIKRYADTLSGVKVARNSNIGEVASK